MKKGLVIRLLESFLCAGSSALLISAGHLYPEFWFVSLFALVPFLWRVVGHLPNGAKRNEKPDNKSAVVLGSMLATCYALVAYPTELWTIPDAFLLKLFALNAIFIAYGVGINRLKRHIGFNVIFIAALWLPLEHTLSHFAGPESLFASSPDKAGLPVLVRIGSLFGLLMISFVIVLVNSLILAVLRQLAQVLLSRGALPILDDKRPYPPFKEILLERRWYYFPDVRAPPVL